MPCNQLILCCTLLLPSIFASIGVSFSESAFAIWWSMYWRFTFSFSPFNEYSGSISFGIDRFDPCSPRDSQESSPTPQFKSMNSSVFSFLYGPTITSIHDYWKNHSFDCMDFVGKAMSLLFSMLSRFVIVFFPRNMGLLTLWLQLPSTVILEPKKIKSVTASTFSPSICHEAMGLDAMILVYLNVEF